MTRDDEGRRKACILRYGVVQHELLELVELRRERRRQQHPLRRVRQHGRDEPHVLVAPDRQQQVGFVHHEQLQRTLQVQLPARHPLLHLGGCPDHHVGHLGERHPGRVRR